MAVFFVNGTEVSVPQNQKLMRYLRDTLRLTSVKDGCSEGACGTCTVLVDGKPVRACVQQTDKLEGKHIVTVEGLSEFEQELYTYAFGEAGAVQCGFCIPGMVLCTKALLDVNENPTEAECANAIKNNLCRCTGYVKIIKAMLLAAKCKREGVVPQPPKDWSIGGGAHRIDVREKVLGYGQYPDDVYLDGMIYASAVRSAHPRARVLAIRTEEASVNASKVSAIPAVRAFLLETQRGLARKCSVIMDGRDIGTVILPNADLKIFLTASAEERAKRRYTELVERGEKVSYEEILREIRERDIRDTTRATAPLKPAEDAVTLDTTGHTLEDSLAIMKALLKERVGLE